ncbi:aquaporin [Acuticoccus sediminis]|uniref:aquaporin n=1 Tax=Acuticoccus sediminis TaxID=2184697 RepID=UPI001CFDDBF2|nr:aquaporin [Acuticoccus sediminis]
MTPACFFENDPSRALWRRAGAEGVGTALLLAAAVGGGLAAERSGAAPAIALMIAASISGALVGLIVALGPVSGGHFNPLISALQWLAGERTGRCAAAYVAAQVVGALVGAVLAGALAPAATRSATAGSLPFGASEALAAFALMLVVFAVARGAPRSTGPFAVGAWLFAAILAFPSGSLANPAVAIAAMAASGPLALTSGAALAAVAAETLGALAALGVIASLGVRPAMVQP